MKTISAALAAFWIAFAGQAVAQTNPVVVELFTSQGCSSCPPADKLMHKLAERDDVIALALHVDYWDYIGWKDEYALPGHTDRQKAYAAEGGRRMIYTPQMIVNGTDDVVGARSMELADLITAHKAVPQTVRLNAGRTGSALVVRIEPDAPLEAAPLDVVLVRFTPQRHADITRGENAGRSLTYANVVNSWSHLGEWDGRGPLTLNAELDSDLPAVVLVQHKGPGRIVAAAELR